MQFQPCRTYRLVALLFLTHFSWARGQTALLAPVADTSLFEAAPDNNLGGLEELPAGTTDDGVVSRLLLKFDFGGQVPIGATITQATLFVTVVRTPLFEEDSTFPLHRFLRDSRAGTKRRDPEGEPASGGEATGNARLHPATLWGTPGGQAGTDFFAEPSSEVFMAGFDTYVFASARLLADVQSWVDEPAGNFGWMLKTES